jgi:hypothetical protein
MAALEQTKRKNLRNISLKKWALVLEQLKDTLHNQETNMNQKQKTEEKQLIHYIMKRLEMA